MNQAIEQIKSINHHFRHAIEQVGEGIVIVEATSQHPLGPQIVFANRTVSEMTGYPRELLLEQPLGLIYEPESLNGLIARLPAVGGKGKAYTMERDALTRRGDRVKCRWTISGVRDVSGALVNFILTFSPLAMPASPANLPNAGLAPSKSSAPDESTIEEHIEQSRVESLALLAGGIAHDFNNVLQTILTYLSLAKLESPFNSLARQHIDETMEATREAQSLVRQILDFTKGREPKIEVVHLGEAMRRAAKLATMGSQIRSDITVPDGLWGVEVDARQIRQVFHNLMVNARQAMPGGGVIQAKAENMMVPAGTRLGLPPGPYVAIRFIDRGCGIPEEVMGRIFDPDFTTKANGNGIGLATCRMIVQRHRGTIAVKSKVNVGTEFRVYLPACQIIEAEEARPAAEAPAADRAALPAIAPRTSGLPEGVIPGHGRVLVVDDQDSVRVSAERLLRRLGYDPMSAATGQEAVSLYRQYANTSQPFHAVLLDMTLPGGLSGDEVMTEIRKMDGDARVIATSGYFDADAEANFRRDGYVGILPKPYAVERLSQKLAEAIQN